jgi:ATP phosphoribosyltransferase
MNVSLLLPKGKYLPRFLVAFEKSGFIVQRRSEREYSFRVIGATEANITCAKMRDIPFLLSECHFDCGVVGNEWVEESKCKNKLREVAQLNLYEANISLVGPVGADENTLESPDVRIFTKYPATASRFLPSIAKASNIVALMGAVEGVVKVTGQFGVVCTETGDTLARNDLILIRHLMPCAPRLYVREGSDLTQESLNPLFRGLV